MVFKFVFFVSVCSFVLGCSVSSEKIQTHSKEDRPRNFDDRRDAEMGKLFGKNLTLISNKKNREKKEPGTKRLTFQETIDTAANTLAFMGIQQKDSVQGFIETKWYEEPGNKSKMRCVIVTISAPLERNLSNIELVVLTKEKRDGVWVLVHTSKEIRENFENEVKNSIYDAQSKSHAL